MKHLMLLLVLVAFAENRMIKPSGTQNSIFNNFVKQLSRSRQVYRYPRSVVTANNDGQATATELVDSVIIDQRHGNESTASVVVNDFLEAAASAAGANVGFALSSSVLGRPISNPGYIGYPVEGAGYGGFNGGYPLGGGGFQGGVYPYNYPSTGIYNQHYDSFNQYPRPDRYPGQGHYQSQGYHHGQGLHQQNYYPNYQNSVYTTSYYDYKRSTPSVEVPLLAAGYYYPSYYYRSADAAFDFGIQSNGQVRSGFIEGSPNIPVLIAPTNEFYTYYLQPARVF